MVREALAELLLYDCQRLHVGLFEFPTVRVSENSPDPVDAI
jgi:hypothetical protein